MFGETILVTTPGAPTSELDEQGTPIPGPNTEREIDGVAVAPDGSDESADSSGQKVITGYKLYLPPTETLTASDRLTIRGVAGWQVQGDAAAGLWTSPFTGIGRGVEVTVRRAS